MVEDLPRLAAIPQISALRRTRFLDMRSDPNIKADADPARILAATGLNELHRRGYRGKGIRLAIVDTDFRGWEQLVADKKLPKSTRLADLTPLPPDGTPPLPPLAPGEPIGHGAHCALAASLAAPDAQLILIRVEGSDPYEIVEAVKYFRGYFLVRTCCGAVEEDLLDSVSALAVPPRRPAQGTGGNPAQLSRTRKELGDGVRLPRPGLRLAFQRPAAPLSEDALPGETRSRAEPADEGFYQAARRDRKAPRGRQGFVAPKADSVCLVAELAGSSSGRQCQPLEPLVPSSGTCDKLLWFQAAGNTRGQAWTGYYRDSDNNGILEFADPARKPAPGRWSQEINFLNWQPYVGKRSIDLPADARVRVSLQWREPHSKDFFFRPGEPDQYLTPPGEPLLKFSLLLQRDPELNIMPADSFRAGVSYRSAAGPSRA